MISNAFLAFYRSLSRHRLFAALNVLGLAFGIAVFMVLTLVVKYEYSYDRWLPHADQVYRVDSIFMLPGSPPSEVAAVTFVAFDLLRTDFPQIRAGTRVLPRAAPVSVGDTVDSENVAWVDPEFFDVLALPLVEGDSKASLAPANVAITETIARKYFATTHALGRTLQIARNGVKSPYTVSAILRDLPQATTLKFGIITALTQAVKQENRSFQRWGSDSGYTFLRFDNARDAASVSAHLRDFIARRAAGSGEGQGGVHPEDNLALSLVALPEAHFHDIDVQADIPGADRRIILSLGAIGLLALGMAAINYINLATARADLRAREVALRKVMGSTRTLLIVQFLAEATALVALAALIGLAITELAVPLANALGGWAVTIDYVQVVPLLLVIILALGLGAGFYPAVLLAAYRPAQVLAAARLPAGGKMGGRLRQILVLVQFTAAIAFAISTLVIDRQADFLRNADRGFDRQGLIIVKSFRASNLKTKQLAILDTLRAVPGVVSAALSDREPNSNSNSDTDVTVPGRNGPNPVMSVENVGRDYFPTYGVKLVAGREPDPARPIDNAAGNLDGRTVSTLINRAAVSLLGYRSADAAIGQQFYVGEGKTRTTLNIIGVMKDVRFMSPRDPVAPQFLAYSSEPIDDAQAAIRFVGVPRAEMMQRLQAAWRRVAPDEPFVANTADERLEEFYKPDEQHARLFSAGAVLAIAIACIGLYGLAASSTSRRVQEIGIRKTLGASTRDVLLLLVSQFIRPVLIANALAWPLAWAAMSAWLAGFDERIALSPVYFIVVAVGALALSTLTVAGQAWRVAHAEPARALRYE